MSWDIKQKLRLYLSGSVPHSAADTIETLEAEVKQLRETLLHMRGYLKLWSDDVDAGLKPTKGSLSEARLLMDEMLGEKMK